MFVPEEDQSIDPGRIVGQGFLNPFQSWYRRTTLTSGTVLAQQFHLDACSWCVLTTIQMKLRKTIGLLTDSGMVSTP